MMILGKKKTKIIYFVIPTIVLLNVFLAFDAEAIIQIAGEKYAENNSHSIRFLGATSTKDNLHKIIFELTEKSDITSLENDVPRDNEYLLSTTYSDDEKIELSMLITSSQRILVQLRSQRRPDTMTMIHIIDPETLEMWDEFFCYAPSPSPCGRYLVYLKGRLNHGPEKYQSDIVLLYRNEESVSVNRKFHNEKIHPYNVGMPVYPPAYAKTQQYFLTQEDDPNNPFRHTISSPFLWSCDSAFVVFLAVHDRRTHVVKLIIAEDGRRTFITEHIVKINEDMIEESKIGMFRHYLRKGDDAIHILSVDKIEWDGDSHILVWPEIGLFKEVIRLAIPNAQ